MLFVNIVSIFLVFVNVYQYTVMRTIHEPAPLLGCRNVHCNGYLRELNPEMLESSWLALGSWSLWFYVTLSLCHFVTLCLSLFL